MKNQLRDEENAELIYFICQKLKYAKSPQSISKLCQQFKTNTVSSRNVDSLAHHVRNWKESIHLLEEYNLDTRARMIFALGVDINVHFLAEIRRFAHVALDEKGRITSYKKKNGTVEFGIQQSPIGAPKPPMTDPVSGEETAKLIEYVLQKTENVVTKRSVLCICKDFRHKTKSAHSIAVLSKKVFEWREKIHESNEFDMNTKVRLLFVLNGSVDDDFLAEIMKNADVELDGEQKIVRYKKHGEDWEYKKKDPSPIIVKEEREAEFQPPPMPIRVNVKREEESPEDEKDVDVETHEESKPEILRKSPRVPKKRELSIMPSAPTRQFSQESSQFPPSKKSPKNLKKSPKLPPLVENVKNEFKIPKIPKRKGITSSSDDSYTYTNADGSGPSTSGSSELQKKRRVDSPPDIPQEIDSGLDLTVSDGKESPAWMANSYANIVGVPFVGEQNARESENGKETKEMTRVYSEKPVTSVKWYLCILRGFIVALNHPIFNELHVKIEFLIEKMTLKDEKLPISSLLLNLENLLMVTTKHARSYQHPDIDWKSFRDFASMLQLAAGTVNHTIMDPFLQKLDGLIEELTNGNDKKISMEKLNAAFKISLGMLIA